MQVTYLILLFSFVQGVSEFLPVSSSSHLWLLAQIFNLQQNGLVLTLALNLGTLLTLIVYFYKELLQMLIECKNPKNLFALKTNKPYLATKLIVATLPALVVGFILTKFHLEVWLRKPLIIGFCLMVFGIFLHLVDKYNLTKVNFDQISIKNSLFIGFLQCLALIPGVSRSGITITAARASQINRQSAVRFSFLLAIPTTLGAVVLTAIEAFKNHMLQSNYYALLLGVVCSFIFGLIFINMLLKFISKFSFKIFMYYRVILGLTIIIISLWKI